MSYMSMQMARSHGFSAAEVKDEAITTRPSSTALLVVDSADRYTGVSQSRTLASQVPPYSFSITRNQSIMNGFFKRIAMTEITFPFYVPNINLYTKAIAVGHSLVAGGVPQPVILTPGFNTPSQIATQLQTQINSQLIIPGNPVVVTYFQGSFLFDAGIGNTMSLDPLDDPTAAPPRYKATDYQLFDMIGLTSANSIPAKLQNSKITRCRFTEYVDIVCSQLTYNQDLKDTSSDVNNRDVLARIYLETENDQPLPVLVGATPTTTENTIPGTYPFTIYRQFATPKQIKWNDNQPIGNLTFEAYDDKGNNLARWTSGYDLLPPYAYPDWRFTMLVSEC